MRLGALLGPIVNGSKHRTLADQAVNFARSGYSSLWSAQAIGRGFMITDPLQALTVAATVAPDVEVGTAVLQLPLYHPMELAHRIYSLQQIAGGRLLLGVGAGSTEADFAAYERDYEARFKTFYAHLDRLREIFADSQNALSPWPAVAQGPDLLFGTWGKKVEEAAHRFDGWIASGHYRTPDEVCAALARYRAAGGGRAIVSTLQVGADTDLGEFGAKLEQFAQAGFDDGVVMLLPGAPDAEAVRALLP
ncbi:MAG: LLM class flavin-dependent oxidoreductase [Pseudomonadota bacterium]